ncbi:hypothetical protein ACFC1I_18605 [Microbacterium sp. NPDC056044]|uniref:DUF4190 domain-containing protein n=1 Tax=Microbacterium sp. NPDC056044 TaxID=3345690 RepID=UPI0035DCD6F7
MTDERMPPPGDAGNHGADRAPDFEGAKNPLPTEKPREDGAAREEEADRPAADEGPRPVDPADPDPGPTAAGARPAGPTVSSVSPDVDLAQDASPLPGAHRGGFSRLPTAPVAVTVETAPAEPGGDFTPDDTSWTASDSAFHRGLAGWSLAFAIVGLIVSMFVGWGFPIGLISVVSAIIALRRPLESRAVAVWAIVLGTLSILYSAGWLLFAATQAGFLG